MKSVMLNSEKKLCTRTQISANANADFNQRDVLTPPPRQMCEFASISNTTGDYDE